jgi:glucuronosyltransferase
MEQVKLVITHAGWGGVMECLLAQKPMLCVPVFGDQPENAQLV